MQRRQFLRGTLGSVGLTALAGCIHTDPMVRLYVRIDTIRVEETDSGWESTVSVFGTIAGGLGGNPGVREPRLHLYDSDQQSLDSVRLPVVPDNSGSPVRTPPPTTTAEATETATPTERPTKPDDTQTPFRYENFAVPAETTVELTTSTAPSWIGFTFAEVRHIVYVDVARYTGPSPPQSVANTNEWAVTEYEHHEAPI